jgi:hypothetical protein
MARVADYLIVSDGKSKLQLVGPGGAKFWSFAVPANIHLGSRSILAFDIWSMRDADNMEWVVLVNNKEVFNLRYNGDRFFANAIHEVMPANLFKLSTANNKKPNVINFMKRKGFGTVEFSDVVIWIQVST